MSGSLDDLGALQRAVMEIVWELGEATVNQVRDKLGRRKPLAYTTVLTVMQKLDKVGLAHASRRGPRLRLSADRNPRRSRPQLAQAIYRPHLRRKPAGHVPAPLGRPEPEFRRPGRTAKNDRQAPEGVER